MSSKNALILLALMITVGCNTVPKDNPSALKELTNSSIENKAYDDEDKNWHVPATLAYKNPRYHSPTPLSHLTAKTITTYDLSKMLTSENRPAVINVLNKKDSSTNSIPTSVWLTGFGRGSKDKDYDNIDHERFIDQLADLTGNNKTAPLVFYCLDSKCWLSYNACLRAAKLGYSNIYWYRGGINSWKSAGLPVVSTGVYRKLIA